MLAYRAAMRDLRTYFLDAHSGSIAHDESMVHEQVVGSGPGIRGQQRKISTSQAGGRFEAIDRLRPAEIVTLDLRDNEDHMFDLISREAVWAPGDVASDADNVWGDPAVVDGHAYVGFTYDYLATRQGWRGMDGRDGRIFSMVNIGQDTGNAFFFYPPAGPEGRGVLGFGDEMDGTPVTTADTVAHEFMHAVTHHAVERRTGVPLLDTYRVILGPSRFELAEPSGIGLPAGVHECGQSYTWKHPTVEEWIGRKYGFVCREGRFALSANEGGAVNEAWSDMFGTAVEFMVHEPPQGPLRADYEIGEDTPPAIRSLERPRSITLGGDAIPIPYPDVESGMVRFLVGEFEDNKTDFLLVLRLGRRREHRLIELHLLRRRPLELHGPEPRVLSRDRGWRPRDHRLDRAGRGRGPPPRYRDGLLQGHDGADAAADERGDGGRGGPRGGDSTFSVPAAMFSPPSIRR